MRYLFNFAFLIFPVILLAQSETTIEEYKYLTKGYAYQKEMGLDGIKEGYDLKKLFTASNGVEFRSLIKGESEIKGVLVILNVDSKSPIYLGLPTNNSSSELKGQAENDANGELSLNDKVKYDHAILEFVMFQLDGGVAKRYLGDAKKNVKASSVFPVEVIDEEYSKIIPLQIDKSEQMTEGSGAFNAGIVNINNNVVTQNNFNGGWVFVINLVKDRIGSDFSDFQYIIALTKSVGQQWAVFGEAQGIKSDFYADNLFRFGGAYLWSKNLQLDTALTFNTKDTPSVFNVNFGASYRFDLHKDKEDNGNSAKDEAKRKSRKKGKTKSKKSSKKKEEDFNDDGSL